MKNKILLFFASAQFFCNAQSLILSDTCDPNIGNVKIFANYHGGELNINVSNNEPNIKIGVLGFYYSKVTLSGPYASNVTEVSYAGPGYEVNACENSPITFEVIGQSPGCIVTSNINPAAPFMSTHGSSEMYCAYTCDTSEWQGGCNTRDQVEAYFETIFNGNTGIYFTQYDCWVDSIIYDVSGVGTCEPIGVQDNPTIVAFEISDTSSCAGDMITITNLSSPLTSPVWTLPGTAAILSDTNQLINYSNAGVYEITLQNGSMCSASYTINVENCSSIFEENTNTVDIYPNPSSGKFEIKTPFVNGNLQILDVNGRLMVSEKMSNNLQMLELSHLPAGVYLVNLTTDLGSSFGRWLKE